MHMRAPLGTRIEVSGRIATLVSNSIEELLPGEVENIVSNCGLPVGPHNLAFIPTPTIGSQDCDLTILLKDEKSPVWDYRRILRKGLRERYPGTEFTFQPSDLTAKILNFGAPAPIDVQINGPDMYANYEFARKLAGKFREIPGATRRGDPADDAHADPHGRRQPHVRTRRQQDPEGHRPTICS